MCDAIWFRPRDQCTSLRTQLFMKRERYEMDINRLIAMLVRIRCLILEEAIRASWIIRHLNVHYPLKSLSGLQTRFPFCFLKKLFLIEFCWKLARNMSSGSGGIIQNISRRWMWGSIERWPFQYCITSIRKKAWIIDDELRFEGPAMVERVKIEMK